jgi:hypothetical protein
MKIYFEALLVYMRNLGVDRIWTEMTMSGSHVDYWDQEFQATKNGDYKKIGIPKQFIKLFDTLVEKYGEEIWDGSQNDWGSDFYRVDINVFLSEREIVITSDIEEQTTDGLSHEYDVIEDPSVQSFLDENEINDFEVSYSGGGDDGYIEDDGYDDEGNQYRLSDDLENYLYSKLKNSFGGWEINEGSSGKFIINRQTMLIEHEWYENEWVGSDLRIEITGKDLD